MFRRWMLVCAISLAAANGRAGGAAASYLVDAGSATGRADMARLSTEAGALALTAAAHPGRYHVGVRAVNGYGSSAASEEIIIEGP